MAIEVANVVAMVIFAHSRSLTHKFMKAIMPVVEKDAKVFTEELKETSVVLHFVVKYL